MRILFRSPIMRADLTHVSALVKSVGQSGSFAP